MTIQVILLLAILMFGLTLAGVVVVIAHLGAYGLAAFTGYTLGDTVMRQIRAADDADDPASTDHINQFLLWLDR